MKLMRAAALLAAAPIASGQELTEAQAQALFAHWCAPGQVRAKQL